MSGTGRRAPADLAFHEVLFEAADNAFLEALVQPLASVIRELREETSSAPETREHAIDYHGRILRRVADRDSEGARDEMREHLVLTEVQRGVDQGPGVLGRAAEVLSRALVGWGGDAEMCTLRVACSMTKKA